MTKKQQLAQERNWNRARIKGACATLKSYNFVFAVDNKISDDLRAIERQLLINNDTNWAEQKSKL